MSNQPYFEGTRQYVGARYVPKFADPIEWSDQMVYEPMTIVTYMNSSYTSRKQVPAGTLPTNNEYWALTGNYNAAIGDIQTEVDRLSTEIDGFQGSIDALETKVDAGLKAANDAIAINTSAISTINTDLTALESTVNSITPKVNDLFKMFNNKRIAIFGDSISDPNIDWDNRITTTWAVRFAQEMSKYNATVQNYAISSAAFLPSAQAPNLTTQITNVIPNYDIGIIMGGINDFFGNSTIGNPYNIGPSVSSVWNSLSTIAAHLKSPQNPPKIYVVTPLTNLGPYYNSRGFTQDYYRIVLGNWAFANGFGVINGADIPGWLPSKYTSDGLHPISTHTDLINDYIISKLLSNGDSSIILEGSYLTQFPTGSTSDYNVYVGATTADSAGNTVVQLQLNAKSNNPGVLTFQGMCPYYSSGEVRLQFIDNGGQTGYIIFKPNYTNNTYNVQMVYPEGSNPGSLASIIIQGWSNGLAYNKLLDLVPTT